MAASTATESSLPLVQTELQGGGRIRYPAAWHAFPLPLGITPGAHLVLAVGTASANPCRWEPSGDGGQQGSCDHDRLPGGGVQVLWATRLPQPDAATPSRRWSAASAECARLGGSRSLTATVVVPGAGSTGHGLEVTACVAGPQTEDGRHQVDAMLDSLSA